MLFLIMMNSCIKAQKTQKDIIMSLMQNPLIVVLQFQTSGEHQQIPTHTAKFARRAIKRFMCALLAVTLPNKRYY